jgi:hypothetical protein
MKYSSTPKKDDFRYFQNFSDFEIVMLCEFKLLSKDPRFKPWGQNTFFNKFKNDWIKNRFQNIPFSDRSMFDVDIQKIIPFFWANTHDEYSRENHLNIFQEKLNDSEIKEIESLKKQLYSEWEKKFKSYRSTKTEFLKDGGYIDHEVTYVWDNSINQYVEKN